MNSAICRYWDLRYQKKLRTAPISVFTPPLLVPVHEIKLLTRLNFVRMEKKDMAGEAAILKTEAPSVEWEKAKIAGKGERPEK